MSINKVSQSVNAQTPQFINDFSPLFNKFIEYYYKSQEKTGYGQNIVNEFLNYLNIDKLDVGILGGSTKLTADVSTSATTIFAENIDKFLTENGTILIDDEVIYYEKAIQSPSIGLSPGISYEQVKQKWTTLANPLDLFDGTTTSFPLTLQDVPVSPPSAYHLIVKVYGEYQIPGVDYTVENTNIIFQTGAPRAKLTSDNAADTQITYQSGFIENTIYALDNISGAFGEGKVSFQVTRNSNAYSPIVDEYVIAIYDGQILEPKVDFAFNGNTITFIGFTPITGRRLDLFSIEAPIPSFGSDAVGFSRVNASGQITSVEVSNGGNSYRFEYPPKVTVKSDVGSAAAIKPLVNGIKNTTLLEGGRGYSDTNPPTVEIEVPTKTGSTVAVIKATVTNGVVTGLETTSSGSGYTFTPRVTFKQPGGAELAAVTLSNGSIAAAPTITNQGQGYTTAPVIYVDEPTGTNPIKASFRANLTDGKLTSITMLNAGQGYVNVPRVKVVDPTGAQILETSVDGNGRVIDIELLSGGSGYVDIPSVYIVDDRVDTSGVYIGGSGATATASIFNGQITDINITNFGSGYSADNPPTIIIQAPPQAKASVEVGLNEITGFDVLTSGSDYEQCRFEGCARAASAITEYTETGDAVFSNNTLAATHTTDTSITCLDAVFVKRLLDKYVTQFFPDIPALDYESIDVRNAIKSVKQFYSTKGTSLSVAYLFKLLYGETVSVSYPKDQIIKPSSATWEINTVLRATLVSGDPADITDSLVEQIADIADPNIKAASALVENFISINTSDEVIYELVLSEETIIGNFVVPYKTKLAEPLTEANDIITVDSTIGWPERNGQFVVGNSEIVEYKEKSLNQFIECTRGAASTTAQIWDSATEVRSNFVIYLNRGTAQEVVMNVVGIVDAQQTTLTDTGSYYLPGDKLTVSKLGGTSTDPQLTTWLYNVKKLLEVSSITFGGINNQSATVTTSSPHGLLVGDQVTVYGANPIVYNGTFLVTSRDSSTVFQYQLLQPAAVVPQGNILISVDLNKGKSQSNAIAAAISPYTTNVQNSFFNTQYVYVASTGIPNYEIGPFTGSAFLPGNQRKLNRFPFTTETISTKNDTIPGPIGTWINGVSVLSYKSTKKKTFGAVTSLTIDNAGSNYDAANPPTLTISGGGGSGATATVTVDGSLTAIEVTNGGSGYTSSPLVSIVGGNGSGASATAIITKGVVSRILINNGGSGYTSQPTITIVGGGGQGATGTASVRGGIKTVTIGSGGSSYTSNPTVTLSSGSGAVAQAIVNNGRIISIAIIAAGSGYTTAPEVTIQGDGFGAVARATIDTDGENAGRVTGIEILNKGIGYTSGLVTIGLNSIGQDAQFTANVFQWTYNLQSTESFDAADGTLFEGYNIQYGGEYAHISNPHRLRYLLGDNVFQDTEGNIKEQESSLEHSPIIGWAFDGNPIYGPYGYSDPTDQGSEISRIRSSYALKTNLIYDEVTNITPSRVDGPALTTDVAGTYIEDYEYNFGSGDLDQYNGRFCKTPEFTDGRYCYFVTIDATEDGNPVFPYIVGPSYNSVVDKWNLVDSAVQQNIPTGVVRYRDPYENVDIDVERIPNASTNALTTEDGDILLFEVEDENRDGIIDQAETDDPEQMFEESPLQLYDYFPAVKFDSKVDIEVETITRFEDASVTGFTIENSGQNYQVNDRLVFDNTDTDGSGVSARISEIKGETVTSYDFETVSSENYGILETTSPHNLVVGDTVFVDYTPVTEDTNKTYIVRQYKGIEQVIVDQIGNGYNTDIPPEVIVDGDGQDGRIEAVVNQVGAITSFNIKNFGSGYTKNPRVILSHPQVFKKAEYFVSTLSHGINSDKETTITDIVVNDAKELFICGSTENSSGDTIGFLTKLSATGAKVWETTLTPNAPSGSTKSLEFKKLFVDGNDVWVAGESHPNTTILAAYNPDVVLAKYTQDVNGLSVSLGFQKAYAGISGSTRADFITGLKKISDTRILLAGYTNTNSGNPYDAYLAVLDTTGSFTVKRKLASANRSEKVTDVVISENGEIFFSLEIASTTSSTDINVGFGKATVSTTDIDVAWIKEISNTVYSFGNTSIDVDEFDEYYITAGLSLKSTPTTKDSFWVGKFANDGDLIWNYRYLAPTDGNIEVIGKSKIDIFGQLNLGYSQSDSTDSEKRTYTAKVKYDGTLISNTKNSLNALDPGQLNRVEGFSGKTITVDNSGDVYVFGQSSWNRNECMFDFAQTDTATDKTGHYVPTLIGNNATDSLALVGDGVAKLFGKDTANPSNWENAAIQLTAANLSTRLNNDWTLEFMLYKDATNSQTHSQTQQTLVAIGDAEDATGGLWMYYDMSSGALELVVTDNTTDLNSAGSGLTSSQTAMFADNTWQFVGLKKEGNTFTGYINGIQIFTGTIADTALGGKDLYIGNIPGKNGTSGQFASTYQGQYYVDNLRLRNRAITPTVPTDVVAIPTSGAFGLAYDWNDDAWFATNTNTYDYVDYSGFGIKSDKNADAVRLGDLDASNAALFDDTLIDITRTAITPVTGTAITVTNTGFSLGDAGFQSLDYNDATITYTAAGLSTQGGSTEITYDNDIWSSRIATVPSPGSQKVKATAVVKDRYFFKVTNTQKIDNVIELTINQAFNFTVGARLVLNTEGGTFINSGYITKIDTSNNKVYVAVNNNDWTNDTNTGKLNTVRFDEQSTYSILGPIPNDTNEIAGYQFLEVEDTTPGTFNISLGDYNLDGTKNTGSGNLDSFARFKAFSAEDYSIRVDEISGTSPYVVGSVINVDPANVSYTNNNQDIQITGLTAVTKITLTVHLEKLLQVTAVANSDTVYCITSSSHYLTDGQNIFVDGNPSQEISGTVYDEYDGAFSVENVISSREFTYKLEQAAVSLPSTTPGDVSIYVKSPTLKMYYGHQYIFDLGHSTMVGANLSFARDSLYKLEYSFNLISRQGTPGLTGGGQPNPTVSFKVDADQVTNISYYFDPSRTGDDSPVIPGSYLDVVTSPYKGQFVITETTGGTITTGDDIMKFKLLNEPEGIAAVNNTSYTTSSEKAVGSIGNIRIVNPGGFYTRLPIVDSILSSRKIERIQINEPGTEYAVGRYDSVPISGDGEGGFVSITVENTTDDEGTVVPGQIVSAVVTSAGKGYTTATIDVEAIEGILGPGLTGSGAELEVVIPPFGSGAAIFTKGENVGKIKKLKNNNFGYDYPHDYTLRPEITFPINAQLTSTSILSSITVTDPGSGYSQAPAVVITGGGGSGAIAEASIKNGRIDDIIVKDPGSGYSSTPTVGLRSSFNYVVNLDLGLLQFAFPHGIQNGAEVTLNVVDTGDGAEFPLASGALGRLNGTTTYYAIAGTAQSLDDDQLKLAITSANAELGDAISFSNAGTGRQQVLTESFGATATANVTTSVFLEGELVYQGASLENATATGYVSTNDGWQIGPRVLKIVDYTGEFTSGQQITGVISKSSGTISDIKIATGVLEIGSITQTTGQFVDDVGKPSEIIQKIQDSYYYQDFSYAVRSSVSIDEWKDTLLKNVHPASFKVFGELNLDDYANIPNKETAFQLTKSVELAREATVPNIQNFTLVEPIYQEFNNTEVLFRQKRLTSSENILTSVVQRIDDISNLFDGVRTAFPLTVNNETVVSNANQLMIVLNGIVQTPNTSFEIQGDSIVFAQAPQPAASVRYVSTTIEQIATEQMTFTSVSGIFPNPGMEVVGGSSAARFTVTSVVGNSIFGFKTSTASFLAGELVTVGATGFAGNIGDIKAFTFSNTTGTFPATSQYGGTIVGASGAQATITAVYGTTVYAMVTSGTFGANEAVTIAAETGYDGFSGNIATTASSTTTPVVNNGLFIFGETITNFDGDTAKVEEINLAKGQETPLGKLRYSVGSATVQFEVIAQDGTLGALPADTFDVGSNYQFGSEIFEIVSVTNGTEATTLNVIRGREGTAAVAHQENTPIYGTDIEITNSLVLSKTTGTYQSTPGLYNIQLNDIIVAAGSGVVARVTATSVYTDPVTNNPLGEVVISEGSSFFGLLFNRLVSTTYPNVVLDDISQSQISIVDFTDNTTAFDSKFPTNELINNYVIKTSSQSGAFTENEIIRNYKIEYGNNVNEFAAGENAQVRKLSIQEASTVGSGFFGIGQVIRSEQSKAEVIGYNQARRIIYLGKTGRCQSSGLDYHEATFNGDAQIDTSTFKYGTASLQLDGTGDYLDIPTSTEFGFGTGAFTLECWIRPASVTGTQYIIDLRASSGDTTPKIYLEGNELRYGSATNDHITGATLVANTWYHVAVSKSGTTTKLFLDGAQVGSDYTDNNNYGSSQPINIGADQANANLFTGHIDELRVSNTGRYSAAFTAPTGIFQGDNNTKLLFHFDGPDGATYTDDWSGAATWTDGDEFLNDAILETTRANSSTVPAGFAGKSFRYVDASNLLLSNKTFMASELVYQLENSSPYAPFSVPGGSQNCIDDVVDIIEELAEDLRNGGNNHIWDAAALYVDRTQNPVTLSYVETEIDETIWVYQQLIIMAKLVINNQTVTVTGNHGLTQTKDLTITDSGDDSNSAYTANDCQDVKTTIDNLLTILVDTLTEADTPTSATSNTGDHLANVTKVSPVYEFLGAKVDAYLETPFTLTSHDASTDVAYTNQINDDTRLKFVDAAGLIRSNRAAIVDKAAADLIARYPDLALDMPRNADGSGSGTLRCKTDLGLILDGVADDIEFGGNKETITAISNYLGTNDDILHIRLQLLQSLYAHDRLGVYIKQACAGTLTQTDTTAVIIGTWGVSTATGDSTVLAAVDTLISLANDMLAPSGDRYVDASDLLYFNKDYIADEALGILDNDFSYTLNGITYTAFAYPDGVNGRNNCKDDIRDIIDSAITDLLTGGNANTVRAAELYLTANLGIRHVEDQLLSTIYAFQQVKYLGTKAINNLLFDRFTNVVGDQYAAQYTTETSYRDITITDSTGDSTYSDADCANVISAWNTLIDVIIDTLTPADTEGRSGARMILFNKNYYKEEIAALVNNQWGAGSWVYNDFLDTVIDDVVHDIALTDTSSANVGQQVYTINYTMTTGDFIVGDNIERIDSGSQATGTILEIYDDSTGSQSSVLTMVVGSVTGTWTTSGTIETAGSAKVANFVTSNSPHAGLSGPYNYLTNVANVQTVATAATISSTIQGVGVNTNLWTNPEALQTNWTSLTQAAWTADVADAPTGIQNADLLKATSTSGNHYAERVYALNSFETLDSGTVTFDNGTETFDTGSAADSQTYTFSVFVKSDGTLSSGRLTLNLDGSATNKAFFKFNTSNGTVGSIFASNFGGTVDAFGSVPVGGGWFRVYMTVTFAFGFGDLRARIQLLDASDNDVFTGNNTNGLYFWGAKLATTTLDPYVSASGETFYADNDYNIKSYALTLLDLYMGQALRQQLTSPAPTSGFFAYTNNTLASNYTAEIVDRIPRELIGFIQSQLDNDSYVNGLTTKSGVVVPAKTFGATEYSTGVWRDYPTPLGGGINASDSFYGLLSDAKAEVERVTANSAKLVKSFKRFRIDGDITDGPFIMNEVVTKQGAPSVTGVVYGIHTDDNFSYVDVQVTAGPWAVGDALVGATNSTTATIGAEEDRMHIIDLQGTFAANTQFKGFTSTETGVVDTFLNRDAAVLDNQGGKLTVDTETLNGTFESSSVVYAENSRLFLEVSKYAGLDATVGQRVASAGYIRLTVGIISGLNAFTEGNRIHKVVNNQKDTSNYGIITSLDLDNNYIYVSMIEGTFAQGDFVGDYNVVETFPIGYAQVNALTTSTGSAAGLIQDIEDVGLNKRLYLSDVVGTFSIQDSIYSVGGYKAAILVKTDVKARVKRFFKGFDGTTSTFKLTTNNGDQYFPDPAGHMLIFVNGILQPPGSSNAYTAFSDQIQFTEAPELGSSFTGIYVGKLRQLDDISFDFDSLRQSFNLRRDGTFYSLTLTDGVQSSVIRPENNIIVSLNGVIQEPGIGFEIVGSRIIFSEIPRVGSTFVAFSYVGSEADVDAETVVPPIEPGDFIDIDGEVSDREVAVIESSNSLITFDYLGSVFGKDAAATANLTSGVIDTVSVTSPGSGYTSRPNVRIDSITGFDAQIRALVGVSGVTVSNPGSGYEKPDIDVETSVPDDWTAPDLSLYGEEVIDPEVLP